MNFRTARLQLLTWLFTGATITTCLGYGVIACKHVEAGCAVVDVVNNACQKLRYREDDGRIVEVAITADDAKEMGRAAAKRAAAQDAGSSK